MGGKLVRIERAEGERLGKKQFHRSQESREFQKGRREVKVFKY